MQAGYDALLRDKTRPSRIPPLGVGVSAERVVTLTHTDPPRRGDPLDRYHDGESSRYQLQAPSNASGARMVCSRTGSSSSSSPTTSSSSTSCAMLSGSMSIRPPMPSVLSVDEKSQTRPSTAPSPACR